MSTSHSRGLFRRCPKSGKIVGYNFRSWWACALFPMLGLAALVWVLIRVSKKPTRVAHPCMQVAMPLASTFIGYVASLVAAVTAARQAGTLMRRHRYVLGVLCIAVALGAASWNLYETAGDLRAADTGTFTPSDPPNSPMGTAKGLYPGRVSWAHDPAATSWDGTSNYWWSDSFNNQGAISDMLLRTVCSVSGQGTAAASWDALFRHRNQQRGKGNVGYASTEKIVVKINLNCGGNNQKIDASPHVVWALLDQLVNQAGVPQANITLYDAQRGGIDAVRNRCQPTFPNVKYNSWGSWVADRISYSAYITDSNARRLPQAVVEAEYMINLASLKRHCQPTTDYSEGYGQTGITVCGKNHFGTIGNTPALHERCRDWYWGMATYNDMVDLIGSQHLGGKTVLYLIDGLYAGDRHDAVPKRWQMAPFGNDWPSSLLASQDPVAIDSVACDFLRTEWTLVANADNYLHEASSRDGSNRAPSGIEYRPDGVTLGSLGVHEHWNNATAKQYTRNLGTGSGIELVRLQGGGTVSVSITSPANDATFSPPATIAITASASDTGGTITKVEFYQNGSLIGTDTSSAGGWTYSWNGVGTGSYALTARATSSTGQTATSSPVTVWVLRNPENPAGAVNGLDYAYYHGTWNNLPDFGTLTPVKTGTVANFDLTPRTQNDSFGFRFTGYVNAASDGLYTFYTTSDDGSRLWIGSTVVVNNDGLHGMVEASGRIGLKAGRHALTVDMFENGGGEGLEVRHEGPGLTKQLIPDAALYRVPPVVAPAAPTGLTATAVSSSQINLAWTDNASNETGFKVERKTGAGGTWAQIATPAANATTCQDTGLSASTTYYYRVRATNAAGDSAYSNEANATTLAPPQSGTLQFNAAAYTRTEGNSGTSTAAITVTRSGGSSGAAGVSYATSNGTAAAGSDYTAASGTLSWSDGDSGNKTFTVTVSGDTSVETDETVTLTISNPTGGATLGSPSTATLTILNDDALPAAPSGLTATAVSLSQINLAWTDHASNETGFKVERKTGAGGTWAQIATPGVNATTYQDMGLPDSTTYYYRVRATNAAGDSSWSNEANATTQTVLGGPGLTGEYYDNADFTGLVLTRTDAQVNLNWGAGSPNASIGADSFSVRWTGRVQAEFSEVYTFTTNTDDGVRLWVNGTLLVDQWVNQGATEWSGSIALQAGQWVTIQMDYFEDAGSAVAQLFWESPSTPREPIPQDRLDSATGPADGRDNDGDGTANDADPDDDNDGIPDLQDPDRDGDGTTNEVETALGTDPDSRISFPGAGDEEDDPWYRRRCGATGLEFLIFLGLLGFLRRRR